MTNPHRSWLVWPVGFLLCCAGLSGVAADAPPASMVPLDLCEMSPVFMEDFDTMSIASRSTAYARWTAHTPWNGDFGDAPFSDPVPGGPFSVADGILHITASKNPEGQWRSGLIAAADATGHGSGVRYGYFEARMKLPSGPGTWPAFWLNSLRPAGDPTPDVEVDVIEYYGRMTDRFSSALHVWYKDQSKTRSALHWTTVTPAALEDRFYDYGVRVSPETITFYLDRAPIWQVPTPPELQLPLFPMVDLALGSGFPIDKTPSPSTLLVDYVHVYALDAAGRQSRCPATASPPPTAQAPSQK